MKKAQKIVALLLAVLMMSLVAACGGSAGADAGAATPSQDTAGGDAATGDGAEKIYKIGVCGRDFTSPFQTSTYEAMEATAAKYPNLELDIRDGEGDSNVQMNIIQTFIEQKKDLVIVLANQVDALVPAVNQCVEAGIPVFNVQGYVGDGSAAMTYIGCDDYEGGWKQGQLCDEMLGGEGKILHILALLGTEYQIQRTAGAVDYLAEHAPGIEIVDSQTNDNDNAKTVTVVQNALTRFPKGELDGIIVQGPLDAIAAADTCIDAGRDELVGKIVAMDYPTQVREAIQEGKLYGTVNQDPTLYGIMPIELAMQYLTGEITADDIQPQYHIDLPIIDPSNVDSADTNWS